MHYDRQIKLDYKSPARRVLRLPRWSPGAAWFVPRRWPAGLAVALLATSAVLLALGPSTRGTASDRVEDDAGPSRESARTQVSLALPGHSVPADAREADARGKRSETPTATRAMHDAAPETVTASPPEDRPMALAAVDDETSVPLALPLPITRDTASDDAAAPEAAASPLMDGETLPETAADMATNPAESLPEVEAPPLVLTIRRGDSLYALFKMHGLSTGDLYRVLAASKDFADLARLRPGEALEIQADDDGAVQSLVYRADRLSALRVSRNGDGGFEGVWETREPERRVATASGVIEMSLFTAGQRAGLSDNLIMKMADVFGWDVDFALDIREGDRFTLVYEEQFDGDDKLRDGPILAAEFVNQGRVIRAVRYQSPDGEVDYYTPEGRSMRKAFLRAPVKFSRISSRFSRGRRHPVLHKIRAHKGVDYAAARGTPVKATGDGKVELAGTKGGFGKTVVLRHGSTYTTLYAHLSRYARGIRAGKRVSQGQTIGYVGSSGLATGPHLHYEFRVHGAHRDPLRVKLPAAEPIAPKLKESFQVQTRALLAQLDALSGNQIAANDP